MEEIENILELNLGRRLAVVEGECAEVVVVVGRTWVVPEFNIGHPRSAGHSVIDGDFSPAATRAGHDEDGVLLRSINAKRGSGKCDLARGVVVGDRDLGTADAPQAG